MRVSRTAFLKVCALASLGSSVEPWAFVGPAAAASSEDVRPSARVQPGSRDATADAFRPHLRSTFIIRSARGDVRAVLAKIVERPVTKNVQQFSLIFHAAAGTVIADGTYDVLHPALGELTMFIVAIGGPSAQRTVAEACFSRMVSARHARPEDTRWQTPS